MYSSMSSTGEARSSSGTGVRSAPRHAGRRRGVSRIRSSVRSSAWCRPGVALVLVGEAVRLPRHREAQLVPVVARRPRRRRRAAIQPPSLRGVEHACPGATRRRRLVAGRRRGRRRGTRCRCRARSRCCAVADERGPAPSAPSGQNASSPPSRVAGTRRCRWRSACATRRTARSGA